MVQSNVWGAHAGRKNEADHLFRAGRLATGSATNRAGDLRDYVTREQLAKKLRDVYTETEMPSSAIPNRVTQLFYMAYDVSKGDLLVYSPIAADKRDRQVMIGEIQSDFEYRPDLSATYPYQHAVTWLRTIPRDALSDGAGHELTKVPALFVIQNYADEFRSKRRRPPPRPPAPANVRS